MVLENLFNNKSIIKILSLTVITAAIIFAVDGAVIYKIPHTRTRQQDKTPWNLSEALTAGSQVRGFNGTWITDEEFYYTAKDKSIHKYNAATNTDSVFVGKEFLNKYKGGRFTLSPDNTKILISYDSHGVFRLSITAKYDVFDIDSNSSFHIHQGENIQYCSWAPTMESLSYVYENNVYIHFQEGLEVPITAEGIEGVIYNGIPDWVYEEEVLSSDSAMWWSPDGYRLAIGIFNDTMVRTYKYFMYGEAEDPEYQYPQEVDLKYPKPGTPNPMVAVRIFDFSKVDVSSVRVTAPADIVSADHILKNVVWSTNEQLIITWMNRRQNVSSIQACTTNGDCHEVKRIEEPTGWIEMGTPICLRKSENCIFTYWIGNWYQVWNLNLRTGENIWKSRGNFTVLTVYGYDEDNDKLYYKATMPYDASVYHIFSNDDCLTCDLRDADGDYCRAASAIFSKNFSYYALMCYGPNPVYTKIMETKTNKEIKMWESNDGFRRRLAKKLRPTIEYLNVTLADGTMGIAKLQLPPNLDKSKKYPMIVFVYGGPNSVRVSSGFNVGFDAYMTTTRQVIYAQIDGRGTGNKGKKLLFAVNNNLGKHEVEDQIFVTRSLEKQFPFIDRERIGIWGWSYGGYMTAKTIANDTDRVFQCGISVAPVTSWIYYDTIYTERYMGLPTEEDNLLKYRESSVLEKTDNFRNHDFLLVHGSGDDNVHYQQSLMLAKELQEHDIIFEEMTYTDENHSIGNFLPHLYNTMDRFWTNCLNLDVDEEEEGQSALSKP